MVLEQSEKEEKERYAKELVFEPLKIRAEEISIQIGREKVTKKIVGEARQTQPLTLIVL